MAETRPWRTRFSSFRHAGPSAPAISPGRAEPLHWPADLPLERPVGPPPTLEDLRKWAEQAGRKFQVTTPEEVAEYAVA